jgi:hypothetical protein
LARKAAAGSAGDLNALIAKLQKEGESKADAERIGRAVVEAIQKSKPKVEIVNSTGGPIEVVGAQSSSAAAGSQSH